VYELIYLDIRLDILYICMRLLPITKDTYMKMFYNITGFLIICFKRNRCRNFIISFRIKQNIINYNYFSDMY